MFKKPLSVDIEEVKKRYIHMSLNNPQFIKLATSMFTSLISRIGDLASALKTHSSARFEASPPCQQGESEIDSSPFTLLLKISPSWPSSKLSSTLTPKA
ncbi:hypothetical protein [Lonsdalea britannica]|uniref:hypothetical protein n=1 Tax=Lonsdalea britannica TaxID=1082704 RepID=UPI00111C6AC9|nr:hypothetical protein [Lonsdalea britannica]